MSLMMGNIGPFARFYVKIGNLQNIIWFYDSYAQWVGATITRAGIALSNNDGEIIFRNLLIDINFKQQLV